MTTFDIDYATAACIRIVGHHHDGQDAASIAAIRYFETGLEPSHAIADAARRMRRDNARRAAWYEEMPDDVPVCQDAWFADFAATLETREARVATYLSENRTIAEIAYLMEISERTVDRAIVLIREKMEKWRDCVA